MNATEHSLMLFILDALKASPSKSNRIFEIAKKDDILYSNDYLELITRLENSSKEELKLLIEKIKKELT